MIIKFTVTLSDTTVAAFAREGATDGQGDQNRAHRGDSKRNRQRYRRRD